ncbi:MAG TPA: PDZ domain-containing protein [Bacteroidia bacterium]|jgi:pimeloyl-ACP methyl ester carboxylesterase|nr:PDZ domain-containing protein [Bacteroidia bacterium]
MRTFLSILILANTLFTFSQELKRRPFLGIQMEKVNDDVKRIMELPAAKGVVISKVIPNSTAEKTGLLKGDVLLKINGIETNVPAEVVKLVSTYHGGDEFKYELIRNKKLITGKSVFKELIKEQYTNIDMDYTSTRSVVGIQRLIVSKPKTNKKSPAIIFIGGIGCYSLDNALDTSRNETQLLNALTRAGFVCVRAEKPGVGDNSNCKPCSEVSFTEELDGYISTVKTVKKYNYIDSNNIYILGHSMGGVFAPMVAQKTNIKGIIAYGTIGSNFMEYLLKTRRTIGEANGWAPDETDAFIKDYCECAGYYFTDKMSSEKAGAKKEVCKEYMSVFDYRSRAYNDELYSFNFPGLWKNYKGKALLLWGQSDFISSKEDHEILTQTVNYYNPGNATFKIIENSTHGMDYAPTFQEAIANPGKFNKIVVTQIINWLNT